MPTERLALGPVFARACSEYRCPIRLPFKSCENMSKKCSRSVWRAPSNLAPYAVSTDTMLAEDGARAHDHGVMKDVVGEEG